MVKSKGVFERPGPLPTRACTTWRAFTKRTWAGFCRRFRVLMRLCRARETVYSITPASASPQFRYSAPSPGSDGGGLAEYGLGASVGRPMAAKTFLMVSPFLIRAMRRSGLLQRGQIVSSSNVLRRSSLQEM
jgi:hypothetical protein